MGIQIKSSIQVLIVEDSPLQAEYLTHILESDPDIKVMARASNGVEALELLKKIKPDVVLTDLHMPKMNGIELIREIMRTTPLPIVANSASTSLNEMINGFNALKAGAVAFVEKPRGSVDPRSKSDTIYLLQTIKLMSEVAVVKRKGSDTPKSIAHDYAKNKKAEKNLSHKNDIKAIVVGVSTGGPLVLQQIISNLKTDFPPILIVQHIATGFITGLAEWLSQTTNHTVQIADHNNFIQKGHIYLAPDNHQMEILSDLSIKLIKSDNVNAICPSVSSLFQSAAQNISGQSVGILLTGMGADGASELKLMKDNGALTIAQNAETSLIFGMPAKAIALNAATYVMSPPEIAEFINELKSSV